MLVEDRDGFDEASNEGIDVERVDGLRVRLSVGSCDCFTEGSDDAIFIIEGNSVGIFNGIKGGSGN